MIINHQKKPKTMETRLVTLVTYNEPEKAYFLKNELEKKDIICFLSDEDRKVKDKGIRVRVKPDDIENAVQIMMDIRATYGPADLGDISEVQLNKKILVPIDFSEFSLTACRFAFGMAEKIGAEIKMLHVYEEPLSDDIYIKHSASYLNYLKAATSDAMNMVERNMLTFTEALKEAIPEQQRENVLYHASFVGGRADEQIIAVADKYEPACIILGTRGKGLRPNDLIGSVTLDVIEKAGVPVLAIPEGYEYKGFDSTRILYATDYNDSDHTSLDRLVDITQPLDANISCVHIDMENDLISNKRKMDELNEYLRQRNYDNVECYLIESDDLFWGIDDFIVKNHIDILSFTTPRRSIFDKLLKTNNLKKMIYQSTIPMLIFRY